jgi:hypothetical protein
MLLKECKWKKPVRRGFEVCLLLVGSSRYFAAFLMNEAEKLLQFPVGLTMLPPIIIKHCK